MVHTHDAMYVEVRIDRGMVSEHDMESIGQTDRDDLRLRILRWKDGIRAHRRVLLCIEDGCERTPDEGEENSRRGDIQRGPSGICDACRSMERQGALPNTKSVTLSREFFEANSDLWSFDDIEIEELNTSMALTSTEATLYNMLAAGVFGRKARLPLERIPLSEIFGALDIEYKEETVQEEENVIDVPKQVASAPVKSTTAQAPVLTKTEETAVEKAANDDEIKKVATEEKKETLDNSVPTTENQQ